MRHLAVALSAALVASTAWAAPSMLCTPIPPKPMSGIGDGCSVPPGAGIVLPHLELFKPGFTPACEKHDRCYTSLGSTYEECDGRFSAEMRRVCNKYADPFFQAAETKRASSFFSDLFKWSIDPLGLFHDGSVIPPLPREMFPPGLPGWLAPPGLPNPILYEQCMVTAAQYSAAVSWWRTHENPLPGFQSEALGRSRQLQSMISGGGCTTTPEASQLYAPALIEKVNRSFIARSGRLPAIDEFLNAVNAGNIVTNPGAWESSLPLYSTVPSRPPGGNGVTPGMLVAQHTDASGKIQVALFQAVSSWGAENFTDFSVGVPSDYVAIGGGVEGAEFPYGSLLMGSHPNLDFSAWQVSAKSLPSRDGRAFSNPIYIKGWAIGMKIQGLTREQLREHLSVRYARSGVAAHPLAASFVPENFTMIGGGFNVVDWAGAGNFVTSSYPTQGAGWAASSKDHGITSPARMEVATIAIRTVIPGVGVIHASGTSNKSALGFHITSSANTPEGYALSGCGALIDWSNAGQLMWKIQPSILGSVGSCEARSKDHDFPSGATIETFALGIRVVPETLVNAASR